MPIPLPIALGFVLTLFRVAGLFLAAPIVSTPFVPVRVRLALAVAVAFAVYLGAGAPPVALPDDVLALGALAAAETGLGLASGLAARLILEAAQAAGSTAAFAMGLSYGQLLDPFNGASSTVPGQILGAVALGAAVALELPGETVAWLARSVAENPPGAPFDAMAALRTVIESSIGATVLAARLAFPFLAVGLLTNAALGVLGRAVPQINLNSLGFTFALLGGGLALFLVGPAAAELAARAALAVFTRG